MCRVWGCLLVAGASPNQDDIPDIEFHPELFAPLGDNGLPQRNILVHTAARQGVNFLATIDVFHAEEFISPLKYRRYPDTHRHSFPKPLLIADRREAPMV